jgi:hypothetical protein
MNKPCNPKDPKASKPEYECNTKTGKWNLTKAAKAVKAKAKKAAVPKSPKAVSAAAAAAAAAVAKKCNPKDPKASKPDEYECNTKTGRWNKKSTAAAVAVTATVAKKPCNPKNPKASDPKYECSDKGRWVLKKKAAASPKSTPATATATTTASPKSPLGYKGDTNFVKIKQGLPLFNMDINCDEKKGDNPNLYNKSDYLKFGNALGVKYKSNSKTCQEIKEKIKQLYTKTVPEKPIILPSPKNIKDNEALKQALRKCLGLATN